MDIDFAQIFIVFAVLLFSLTVHEMAHAWAADRLGDPTARLLGRVSLNPLVHADPIGTVIFPLIGLITRAPIIGWAKPVPVDIRNLRKPRRDYVLVAAAGPASNLVIAFTASCVIAVLPVTPSTLNEVNISAPIATILNQLMYMNVLLAVFNMIPIPPLDGGNVLAGLLPPAAAATFNRLRPYGFLALYALILTGGFNAIVIPPFRFIVSWLPSQ